MGTGDRYHRGPSFTIFLRPKSFSNKLNVGADPNCNKKGGVFMYDSCTSMLEITGFQTIFYINVSSSGIFFLIWEQGWSFVYLPASLCTNIFDMNIFYILKCVGGGGGVSVGPPPENF